MSRMARIARSTSLRHATLAQAWLWARAPRVLVVGEREAVLDALAAALRQDGLAVTVAARVPPGSGGLAPDIVVTEAHAPGPAGLTALRELREHDPATPVVVISAFDDLPTRLEAARLGVAAFFAEPFDVADLETVIANLAQRR